MAVRIAREEFLWLLEIDWPIGLRTRQGWSSPAYAPGVTPNQVVPVATFPVTFRGPKFEQRLKTAADELADWLDDKIGPDNWQISYSDIQDDHSLMSNRDREVFLLRVKTQEEAVLVQLRWG